MLKSVIWLDDKKKLKSIEVTMSTETDWAFARNFQDFLVDKVVEFSKTTTEREHRKNH